MKIVHRHLGVIYLNIALLWLWVMTLIRPFFLVVGTRPQSICSKEPGGHTSLSLYSIVFVDL